MTRARFRPATAVLAAALFVGVVPFVSGGAAQAAPIAPVSTGVGCDPLDPAVCLLPFPNDLFTVADPSTGTGRRVNFSPLAMPRNGAEVTEGGEGKPIDPTEWNRNDGFSPGAMVMTYVPGIDLHQTWSTQDRAHSEVGLNEPGYFDYRDHIADIDLYQREDAPMVIINTETGERHPFWSELDTHPGAVDAGEQVLIMRPAVNFYEGTRYVVALRDLKNSAGATIEPRAEFVAYRSGSGADAARQTHYDADIFPVLEQAGIARDDLYLAWDFTVASERNLAERVLHIRDDAFGRILGDTTMADGLVQGTAPEFVIDSTEDRTDSWTDSRGVARSTPLRRVRGRIIVPNYLDRIQQTEGHVKANGQAPEADIYYDAPVPGSRFLDIDLDGLPDQNPAESTVQVPFVCDVPLNDEKNYPILYGHGLLGTRDQIGDIKSPRRSAPFLGCAADWWGMSSVDLPTVAASLGDMSNFPSLPDRAQQGFLNFMFLGRASVHPDGFATDPAFQNASGESLVKVADETSTPLFYDGNSQGGIMGGSLVAVSPDIKRAILGVVGMNYSTLLNRSVDWEDLYAIPFYEIYQDPVEQQLAFALIQMLWDRGEANGYAQHMTTDPLPNTPPHEVMLQVAFGDHQVSNVAAEVEARTIGAPIIPGLADGRHWEMDGYFSPTVQYPYKGSALIYWDSGNATPPNGNVPANHSGDPHGHPRNEPAAAWQEAQFLLTGWMVDVCNGGPYLTLRNPLNNGTPSCREPEYAPGSQIPTEGPDATAISFTEGSADSGQYSDDATFAASVSDSAGAALAGVDVVFELSGPDGSRTLPATTGSDGIARATTTLTDHPGDYQVTASYAGNDDRAPASISAPFAIEKEDTTTSLEKTGKGNRTELVARLADADSSAPIAGAIVDFYADGNYLGSASTDETGTATLPLIAKNRKADSYEARFAGDEFYLGSRRLI